MMRPWRVWLVFGASLAVMLVVMAWVSLTVLGLDDARADAQYQAQVEEAVRLALWRMDAAVTPVVLQEDSRPYYSYSPFYPAGRAYTRAFDEIRGGDVLVPSPLLAGAGAGVALHFQFDPLGRISSPEVPPADLAGVARANGATEQAMRAFASGLAEVQRLVGREALLKELPAPTAPEDGGQAIPGPVGRAEAQASRATHDQHVLNFNEYQARWANTERAGAQARSVGIVPRSTTAPGLPDASFGGIQEGPMRPVWVGDTLLLGRRVIVNGQTYVQGCWLDWPAMKKNLLEAVRDLLPSADLVPASPGSAERLGRLLAALPVRLVPGPANVAPPESPSPLRLSLLAAWGCLLLAVSAVAALLSGVLSLNRRQGDFVSAVTHELRTPLTTFRLYTEMLAGGTVRQEDKRARYIDTLRTEALRLSGLVENVLTYAGLEARHAGGRGETASVRDLLDRACPRAADRAEQAGMELFVEAGEADLQAKVRADRSAVEHILFNLVDNACKYAASAADRRIHLEASSGRKRVLLRVRDHGAGIAPGQIRRLFRPFSKSARRAADSAPGVGLGLSLARRLARRMGGDLQLDSATGGGACFVLTLRPA